MIQIIPAIDLIDGKCVRLTQGDFNQKTEYDSSPVEIAKIIEDAGIKKLHVVDLDGAKHKKIINHKTLEAIVKATKLDVDFGGGLQSDQDVQIAFDCGAKQITGGSIAVKNRPLFEQWILRFGPEKIILGADVRNEQIAVSGWQEVSNISVFDFIDSYIQLGLKYIFCTDVAKDGLLQGPSFKLYEKIKNQFPDILLIASGGVTTTSDVEQLNQMGVYGAIIGKAYYEGKIQLLDLQKYIS
ncbi:MAG: 1-(5-phosphoribosyl)-5-[(5-phosphoribosylamino)methylideneamino]imidazole-4-carboxamide isomerase [Cytophagales bacterium]|nr:MAG: 1-(5-phosphoribosyl)-5-[(5-phosphoribosylamino)methylideneamino]imidazole-4-carboxamide isomerase [Cytophagales bacterium]